MACATGIDPRRGQIVGVTGIRDGADVGAPVTEGTVDYDVRYDSAVARDVSRSSTFISGTRADQPGVGQTTLRADFGRGRLTSVNSSELDVDARINGQAVSGTVTANYSIPRTIFGSRIIAGSVDTQLDGRIGSTGMIATFEGASYNQLIVSGLVGTPN